MDSDEAATFVRPGSPPITQTTFPACRAQYPGGPNRCLSVSSLSARPSPVNRRVSIHDFTFEACSSFTRVTAYWVARPPKGGLSPEASTRPVARPRRSVATMSHRQLHGWILLPLVICAFGAHVESRKSAVRGLLAAARFPSPLVKPDEPISSIRLSDRLHHWLTESSPRKDAVHQVSRTQFGPSIWQCPAKALCGDGAGTPLRADRRSD
jgi:hypothetical protein